MNQAKEDRCLVYFGANLSSSSWNDALPLERAKERVEEESMKFASLDNEPQHVMYSVRRAIRRPTFA